MYVSLLSSIAILDLLTENRILKPFKHDVQSDLAFILFCFAIIYSDTPHDSS